MTANDPIKMSDEAIDALPYVTHSYTIGDDGNVRVATLDEVMASKARLKRVLEGEWAGLARTDHGPPRSTLYRLVKRVRLGLIAGYRALRGLEMAA